MNVSAAEAITFLHNFHSVFGGPLEFSPQDPEYEQFFRNISMGCFALGMLSFILLLFIAGRKMFRFALIKVPQRIYVKRYLLRGDNSIDVFVVILLGVVALSALGGLFAEAQVDYGVTEVARGMKNASITFANVKTMGTNISHVGVGVQQNTEDMLFAYNRSQLPKDIDDFTVEVLRLVHVTAQLQGETSYLPQNFTKMAIKWEHNYIWIRSSTNMMILAMVLSCFMSMAAIGWSMTSVLRLAIFLALVIIPSSHGLFGIYMANSIETADFCMSPAQNTLKMFANDSNVSFYVQCASQNETLYPKLSANISQSLKRLDSIELTLEQYAAKHSITGLQEQYLDPIRNQLDSLTVYMSKVPSTFGCSSLHSKFDSVVDVWCTNGVLGLFSIWVHQMMICCMIFIAIIGLVSVYENVKEKEDRMDMHYHLLGTYEEDNIEHLYLTPE